jgi:transposase
MVRIVGNSYYVLYKKTINERIEALENDKLITLTTNCSCSATNHDNVGTFAASFSYADIKAKGIDIDNTNNGFNILKYIFWKEQTIDGKTYKLSFSDGMETFKIENISMFYNFDGEKISSIDFEGIYKPQESIETPTNYMNLDIILVNR